MLSPQLLAILRTYWRLARPREWLYPGRHESKPIDVQVLHAACRSATKAAGLAKRVTVHTLRHSPHGELDEPRHASSGKRRRHPHHPGAFGPQQPVDNGTLNPRPGFAYLGRYTHRVAIANSRLVAMDETQVRLRWRDYWQDNKNKLMTLDASEFSAASCSTACPTASTASVTTASWPTASGSPSSP